MGRVGSCFDNAAAEAFFSSLEWEVLSRHEFTDPNQARAVVLDWCYGFDNRDRRHSTIGMMSPINYENNHMTTASVSLASILILDASTVLGEPQIAGRSLREWARCGAGRHGPEADRGGASLRSERPGRFAPTAPIAFHTRASSARRPIAGRLASLGKTGSLRSHRPHCVSYPRELGPEADRGAHGLRP